MPDNLSKAHESMATVDFSSDDLLVREEQEKERLEQSQLLNDCSFTSPSFRHERGDGRRRASCIAAPPTSVFISSVKIHIKRPSIGIGIL